MQPKAGNSDTVPEIIVLSNNFYQCHYNIVPYKKIVDGETVSGYSYDYIELKYIDGNTIGDALIENNQECDQAEVIKSIVTEEGQLLKK